MTTPTPLDLDVLAGLLAEREWIVESVPWLDKMTAERVHEIDSTLTKRFLPALIDELREARAALGRVEALADEWRDEAARYTRYVEGSSLPEMHRAIAKTLNQNSAALRAFLARVDGGGER